MTTSTDTPTTKSETKSKKSVTSISKTPIADNVTESLHQSVDKLGDHAASAEERIRETATNSSEAMTEKQELAKQYWQESTVGKYTKENPVATAGIAFVAGVLLTSLIRRK